MKRVKKEVASATAPSRRRLDYKTAMSLALDAGVHYRTIRKVYDGEPVKGPSADKAREALVRAGFEPLAGGASP